MTVVSKYIQAQGLGKLLAKLFPTVKQNATKFSTTQIMLAVVLVSMSDVHRMSRIENFTCDPLVQYLNLLNHNSLIINTLNLCCSVINNILYLRHKNKISICFNPYFSKGIRVIDINKINEFLPYSRP